VSPVVGPDPGRDTSRGAVSKQDGSSPFPGGLPTFHTLAAGSGIIWETFLVAGSVRQLDQSADPPGCAAADAGVEVVAGAQQPLLTLLPCCRTTAALALVCTSKLRSFREEGTSTKQVADSILVQVAVGSGVCVGHTRPFHVKLSPFSISN